MEFHGSIPDDAKWYHFQYKRALENIIWYGTMELPWKVVPYV
jgi:hypothetical protein